MVAIAAPPRADIEVAIRPVALPELRWVCATWGRGMRATTIDSAMQRKGVRVGLRADGIEVDASLWSRAHARLVDALLESSTVLVATLPDMPDEPCGWVAHEGPVLHYVFVAPIARRAGVARQLIRPLGCSSASHMTSEGAHLTRYLRGVVE